MKTIRSASLALHAPDLKPVLAVLQQIQINPEFCIVGQKNECIDPSLWIVKLYFIFIFCFQKTKQKNYVVYCYLF